MHPNFKIAFISILAICVAIILFFIKQNYILFNFPNKWEDLKDEKVYNKVTLRKEVDLYLYKDGKRYSDKASVVWKKEVAEDLKTLINTWLLFAYDEQETVVRSSFNTVALSQTGQEAYLSFDSSILMPEWSVFKKWSFIEGLLTTIRKASNSVRFVFFWVKDKRLIDEHLDFSKSWPIDGFLIGG